MSNKSQTQSTEQTSPSVAPPQQITPQGAFAPEASFPELRQASVDLRAASPGSVLALQRLCGNQAVQRMLSGGARSAPSLPSVLQRQASLAVQRHISAARWQKTAEVQRSGLGGSFEVDDSVESRIKSQGGGKSLDAGTRSFMESRFGHNFGNVQVHTGSEAVQLNRELGAEAFTHGSNIYFNEGRYNPGSESGQRLLAHELTHTIQQTGGAPVQRKESSGHQAGCSCASCGGGIQLSIQRHSEQSHQSGCGCASCQIQAKREAAHTSDCGCASCQRMTIQAKLTVGAANDHYEQEADRVADQVLRMPDPNAIAAIQRCASCDDDHVHRKVDTSRTSQGSVVQRHAAYEHYMLGQLTPDKISNIALIREIREEEKAQEPSTLELMGQGMAMSGGMMGMGMGMPMPMTPSVSSQSSAPKRDPVKEQKKEDGKHVLEQEMARLSAFMEDPEALSDKEGETGKVSKGVDGKWQVPYVSLPVKGDDKKTGKAGDSSIVVTYSEINTMPDFFGNPETIANTRKKKVLHLLQGVRQQTYIELSNIYKEVFGENKNDLNRWYWVDKDFEGAVGPRGQAVNDWAYEKRTEMQVNTATERPDGEKSEMYFAALERNACHFAPYSWDAWERYHTTARRLATESHQAGVENRAADKKRLANEAMLQNAFGEHYLQDSFAAGHLIDKTKIMQGFTKWMIANKSLGSTDGAQARISMSGMIANKDLQSDPQALDDTMHRTKGTTDDFTEKAATQVGLAPTDEIIFMMWWRHAASKNDKYKHRTPAEVAAEQGVEPASVRNNAAKATELMEKLVSLKFAKKKVEGPSVMSQIGTGLVDGLVMSGQAMSMGFGGMPMPMSGSGLSSAPQTKEVYSIDQTQVEVLSGGGPYKSTVAKTTADNEEAPDFKKEAAEFNLAAYNAFMSNAYIQGATKYFHDTYCKQGLEVVTGTSENIGTIYGDANMMKAGAQKGLKYSAATAELSRDAIFNILDGHPEKSTAASVIKKRFPVQVVLPDGGGTKSLADWNAENLMTDEMFKKAADGGARLAYKFKGGDGISGGNAIDVERIVKHDGDLF